MSTTQTVIACTLVVAWLVSLAIRVAYPALAPMFATLDSVILLVAGFMFSSNAIHRRGGGS